MAKLIDSWDEANKGKICDFCGSMVNIKIYHNNTDEHKQVCRYCLNNLDKSYHGFSGWKIMRSSSVGRAPKNSSSKQFTFSGTEGYED